MAEISGTDTSAFVKSQDLLDTYRVKSGHANATADDMFNDVMVRATPASVAPPQVGQASACGSAMTFARADHTHKSSVQRQRVSVPLVGSTGKGAVTFGQPYDPGVTPVIVTEAQTPDQTGYVYLSSVVSKSNTGFTVMVRKLNASVTLPGIATALLNYVVGIFGLATGTVDVEYVAAPATA